jgi:HEAT repeat protein
MTESQGRALLPDLNNPSAKIRLNAALQLTVTGWTFAIPDLMRLAKNDPDHAVRKASIYALGEIGDYAPYSLLQSIWQSNFEPADVVQEALDACDKIDGLISPDPDDVDGGSGRSGRPDF